MEDIRNLKWDKIDISDRIETPYNCNPNFRT
jgi:hypothetical protein